MVMNHMKLIIIYMLIFIRMRTVRSLRFLHHLVIYQYVIGSKMNRRVIWNDIL